MRRTWGTFKTLGGGCWKLVTGPGLSRGNLRAPRWLNATSLIGGGEMNGMFGWNAKARSRYSKKQ